MPDIDIWKIVQIVQVPVAAFASAILTSFLQNKDHRYRKRWELRVDAYRELIDALSDIEAFYAMNERSFVDNSEVPEVDETTLRNEMNAGYAVVRKSALQGAFLYSPGVEAALHLFLSPRPESKDWYERIQVGLRAVSTCRKQVIQLSETDLRASLIGRFLDYIRRK